MGEDREIVLDYNAACPYYRRNLPVMVTSRAIWVMSDENALAVELRKQGMTVEQQKSLQVLYDGEIVGEYFADLFVDDDVVVELKAVKELHPNHQAQLMNYLRACNKRMGLLINFGNPKVEIKRILNGY